MKKMKKSRNQLTTAGWKVVDGVEGAAWLEEEEVEPPADVAARLLFDVDMPCQKNLNRENDKS